MTAIALAALAGVLGLARLGVLVALHLVRSEYSPIRHAVSDYARGPTRPLSAAMSWLGAAHWLTLAGATYLGLPNWTSHPTASIMLLGLGIIFVLLPSIPTDLEGEQLTIRGALHYLLAIGWFGLAFSLTGDFSRLWADAGVLGGALDILHWIALVSLVALVTALAVRPLRRIAFGLAERAFLVAISLFYLGVAFGLATQNSVTPT